MVKAPAARRLGLGFDDSNQNKCTFRVTTLQKNNTMSFPLNASVKFSRSQFTCTYYPKVKGKPVNTRYLNAQKRANGLLTGGINSSLSGPYVFPRPGKRGGPPLPLPLPGKGPGPTGSNLARGGAPIGGRKPSPPHGPRSPPPPPGLRSLNMGWSGPTNIPSPPPGGGNKEGGENGFIGIGSRSRRPIESGFSGGM